MRSGLGKKLFNISENSPSDSVSSSTTLCPPLETPLNLADPPESSSVLMKKVSTSRNNSSSSNRNPPPVTKTYSALDGKKCIPSPDPQPVLSPIAGHSSNLDQWLSHDPSTTSFETPNLQNAYSDYFPVFPPPSSSTTLKANFSPARTSPILSTPSFYHGITQLPIQTLNLPPTCNQELQKLLFDSPTSSGETFDQNPVPDPDLTSLSETLALHASNSSSYPSTVFQPSSITPNQPSNPLINGLSNYLSTTNQDNSFDDYSVHESILKSEVQPLSVELSCTRPSLNPDFLRYLLTLPRFKLLKTSSK